MLIQIEKTPNPNSLKFLPGKEVSTKSSFEIKSKDKINNELVRNIFSVNGVTSIFLGKDFISVNKKKEVDWEDIKHIVSSLIDEFYSSGNKYVINTDLDDISESENKFQDIEKKIIKILETKVRPAVARDGGDIKFKEFNDGIVKVELRGSCSGCPSSVLTLKQGVQNLLCHYIPEVKEVIAI